MDTIPNIPPEIWRQILRFATEDPPNELPLFYDTLNNAYKQPASSKRMKLTLVSVCRQFRQIAFEFLYETLNITNAQCARRLADVLRYPTSMGNSHSAMIKWTHYIGIFIMGDKREDMDVMEHVLYILQLCKNLRGMFMCLSYCGDEGRPYQQWRKYRTVILHTIPSTLDLLGWEEDDNWFRTRSPDETCAQMFLKRQSSSLRSLELSGHHILATPSLSFPQLTHITLRQLLPTANFSFLSSWETPVLVHLKLNGNGRSPTNIASFWDNAKPSLLSVDLSEFSDLTTPLVQRIITMSHHLQQISYNYSLSCADMWQGVDHSSLRDISIALGRFTSAHDLDADLWERLHDHFRPLSTSTAPLLKTLTIDCYNPSFIIEGVTVEESLFNITATLRSEGVHVSILHHSSRSSAT